MATLQLDLFPMTYYNTLGFDRELIDYIDFVDDLWEWLVSACSKCQEIAHVE